jgi:hypothetical protein
MFNVCLLVIKEINKYLVDMILINYFRSGENEKFIQGVPKIMLFLYIIFLVV